MDPKKIRALLGLQESASDADVQKKLESHFTAASTAVAEKTQLAQERDGIVASLKAGGYKIDGGKVVKLAQDPTAAKPEDTDEIKELRKLAASAILTQGRTRIASATELAQKFTAAGPVPPAMKAELEKLFSMAAEAEVLSLSQDGSALVKTAFDAVGSLKKVLESIPGMSKEALSRLGTAASGEEKKEKDALREKGRAMAASIKPKKAGGAGK